MVAKEKHSGAKERWTGLKISKLPVAATLSSPPLNKSGSSTDATNTQS